MVACAHCHIPFEGPSPFCCHSCELLFDWTQAGLSPLKKQKPVSEKWRKYNLSDLEANFNLSELHVIKKFKFYVDGLQCSSCVHLLEELPLFSEKVNVAKVNFGASTIEIHTGPTMGLGELCDIIEELGYQPTPLKEKSDLEAAKEKENRVDLKRMGVAAAVAANEMLFAIPIYAGLDGQLATVFKYLSFVIFLPLLLYSARPFYKKAWVSLLVRRLNVDMMIIVALYAGFTLSTYSIVTNGSEIYFDSTASFIFLILTTRYFLKKHQARFARKDVFSELFSNEAYELCQGEHKSWAGIDSLKEHDQVRLSAKQLVPCDSVLMSAEAEFDLSFLTGEAYPVRRRLHSKILAGSRLVSGSALVQCEAMAEASKLAQSLAALPLEAHAKNKQLTLADILSHRVTLAVFAIATLFFILTVQELGIEAFKRSLALLTIACPCAIAFGAPLAQSIGIQQAFKRGFYVRTENIFEKMNQLGKIIFDKTGTLTSPQLNLTQVFPPDLDQNLKEIILGLENESIHPVALSLKKAWSGLNAKQINHLLEVPGEGVTGEYMQRVYSLAKSNAVEEEMSLQADFSIDGRKHAYLYFQETLRTEAKPVIDELYHKNFEVKMLSGDRRARSLAVARQLGIRPSNVFSDQSDTSKKEVIEAENPCLYIGDGVNDVQALRAANVSFAVRGPFEATFQVCDVYAPQKNLSGLTEFLALSKKVYQVIQANLLFAVAYNSVGGILALSGYINPLAAAVLMPISSLIITSHTVWRLK